MAAASPQGQALVQRTAADDLIAQVRGEQFRDQVALALPENVTPQRFIRGAVTALMAKPEIAELELNSVFRALIQCAHDGLLPDGQEAAIVPHKGKATYMPMVGGFRKIAADHGWMLRAQAVYKSDAFDYSEEPATLVHRPVQPGEERGGLIAAYAIATHRDGRRMQVVLHPDEIAKRRAIAQTQNVWNQWTAQMWAKTAARDLFADLPLGNLDERVQRVIEASRATPQAATELIYGPPRRELTPGEPAPADVEGERASQTLPDRQVGDAASGAAASPAPDTEDDAEALAEAAGQVLVPTGQYAGQTIAAVHEYDGGEKWLLGALDPKRKWNEPESEHFTFAEALRVYVQAKLPEVWAAHSGGEA